MKIVVLDRSSVGEDVSVEAIKQFGEVDFYNSTPDELVAERIADANIVVANKSPMNESTMKDAKQVKMICQLSTGYDNVDIEYCKNRGIHVANARNYSTAAVAQHTVALALSVLENLPYYDNYVKSGAYASQPRFAHFKPWYELEGKTWGIAGMGNIGRRVAKAAEALGCKVIFFATSGHSDCRDYEQVDWDTLLAQSDILSLHCPLSDRTFHLMNADAFSKMKKSAVLINVARGAVVDTDALYEAVSALATVGLTAGATSLLSVPAKILIIIFMYFGRVGVLTISLGFLMGNQAAERYRYAETSLLIG